MAKNKKSNWGSVLSQLPELIGKAVNYFDGKLENVSSKKIFTSGARHIDQVYLERFEKSLPAIVSGYKKEQEDIIHRKSYQNDLQIAPSEYGYKDRQTFLNDATLFRMSMKNSIVSSIIITRTNQISNFSRPQRDRYAMGFEVIKKKNDGMSEEDVEKRNQLEEFILNCGFKEDRPWNERMNFEEYIRRIIPDRLIYDAVATELVPCEDGTLHHFVPVSSATIRHASPQLKMNTDMMVSPGMFGEETHERPEELKTDPADYKYVQLYNGMIVEGFTEDELIYRQGNPTNEPNANGYSIPELERLVSIVASHIFAETHNKQFFTGGFTANGILHFEGDIPQEQIDGFRRSWETQVTGANNSFRTPIIATEEKVSWLPINISNKDMEWKEWMNYLIKIICAIYQIDPSEIGFWDLSQGQGGSLNEGNRNEQILKQSRDKGLRPMLRFVESIINDEIFPKLGSEVHENFEFRFVGLESEERIEETARHEREVKSKKTVNQVRHESGLPPLPNMDTLILDPVYFQWYNLYSPEAVELKVKNRFLEMILMNRYDEQLKSLFPEQSLFNNYSNNSEDTQQASEDNIERSMKHDNRLMKVEYLKV